MRKLALLIFTLLLVTGIVKSQNIYTVVGNGIELVAGDGGPATTASIRVGQTVIDRENNLYISCFAPHVIRKVDLNTGLITKYAGAGTTGFSGDGGLAINAEISLIADLATNKVGDLFLYDGFNHRIRKINKQTGIIATVAGNGTNGTGGDGGPALLAEFTSNARIAVDSAGNIYIGEMASYRIRRIDAVTNIITTIAGTGNPGYSGDGGPALQANIDSVFSLCLDKYGNVYISSSDERIRKINVTSGMINTVAGVGNTSTCLGDGGLATSASLHKAYSIVVDNNNNIYTAEYECNRIRKVDASTQIISTVAGTGAPGFSGDGGPANVALVNKPSFMTVDTCGNLYFMDAQNYRVRRIDFAPSCLPLSIDDIISEPLTFTLSPNPASSQITITSNTKLKSIIITNTVGAVVKRVLCGGEKEVVDIGGVSSGMYFVKVVDVNGGVRVEKVVKE